jgi:hypothetical protein
MHDCRRINSSCVSLGLYYLYSNEIYSLLTTIYLFKVFLRQPQPCEPDLFIDHEEVKREHEKNK